MSSFTNIPSGYISPNGIAHMSNGSHKFTTPNGNIIINNPPLPINNISSQTKKSSISQFNKNFKR